jgi:tetratricopeptide (TPR) repeat protein
VAAPEVELPPVSLEAPGAPAPFAGRSRLWLAIGCAAVLILAVAWTVASRRKLGPAGGTTVAVVGFRDLSPRRTEGWVGTALTEMLAADLGLSGPVRLIPSDDVASMRRDLGLRLDGPLGRAELAQIRSRLGSEWVIVGSYLLLEDEDPPLRVDALLRDTDTGETRATVSRRGREGDLFKLSDALAVDLRRALGQPADSDADARAAMPEAAEAQRLYAQGLEALQGGDLVAATGKLQAAAMADPRFPGTWLALARAQTLLGAGRRAEDAAQTAVQQASGWPERQQLTAEVAYLDAARRPSDAADRMRRLYDLSGRAFEDGLTLCHLQIRAGRPKEALATVAELRREHPAAREDARLALAEADAFNWLEDHPNTIAANERAIVAARRHGMVQVEIQALHLLAIARIRRDGAKACGRALGEIALARRKAEASGDRLLLSGVLLDLGAALSDCDQTEQAEKVEQETLVVLQASGALAKMAPLLFNLGSSQLDRGNLFEADHLRREALATCASHGGILCRERFLHPIGAIRLHRGELTEAQRMIDEGIALNLRLGNESRVAEARSYLPDLAAWRGDLARAIELQRRVLAECEKIGVSRGIAWAHSDLAYWLADAGQGAEALEHARRAVALAPAHGETTRACSQASLAFAELATGDLAAADRDSAEAFARLRPPRSPLCSFMVWRVRSQVLLARGRLDAAEPLIAEGLDLARRNGFVTYELQGRLFRAQLAQKRGRTAEARELADDLAAEAHAKGFGLIAQRCAAL